MPTSASTSTGREASKSDLKIGQRVLCTCEDRFLGTVTVGKVGTIIADARPKMDALLVEFDEGIGGHDGGLLDDEGKSLGRDGHCNWVKPECLVPLT